MSESHVTPPGGIRKPFALLILGLGVTAIVLLWAFAPNQKPAVAHVEQPPPPAPEIPRRELTLRDELLYQGNTTNLFTGVAVEFYQEGGRWTRAAYVNGRLNGASEIWYPNGQMQVLEHFKDGVSDGVRQKWHENGKPMAEATLVQGKFEGTFRRWHDNGQLAEQIEMKHGQREGMAYGYFPSGFLQWQVRLSADKELERKTWNDGERKSPPTTESDK